MAKSNRERVGDILDLLKEGLGPFVLSQYKSRYRARYLLEAELKLYNPPFSVSLPDENTALERLDAQACLKLMVFNWNEAFKDRLGKAERNYAHELMAARNTWAHQKTAFSNEQARRIAETAKLLLQACGLTAEAQLAAVHYNELLRIQFEREARNATRQPPRAAESPRTTDAALKPWRQIIEPHPDVRSGRFAQADFAADLGAVMQGKARPEYQDGREFFERTYMTEGLRDLIVNGVKRLTGAGGDPVVQLQTNFGGGKTHSMLALYHAFGETFKLSDLRDYDEIQKRVGDIDDDLRASRAVIVGTSFNVSQPRQHRDCSTRTIWGEIAWQLGGGAAYELVEQNDLEGTNPGADTLAQLLEAHGPALIILDELVRLTQQLYGVAQAPAAGRFEAVLAFMQSLTEAVKRSSDALLLVAIPASEIEIGGEGGYTTLEKLRQTLGRLEAVWKAVSAEESYEIVRRRLFSDVSDYPARDAVVNAFQRMYADGGVDYPRGVAEADYRRRMSRAYPIHPELFERLYEDWSTLERFQRTRGVLRMMAAVIHRLWIDGDQSLMIMPGSIPLWDKSVANEVNQHLLPRNFSPVVEADIDGTSSKTYQIDQAVKQLGKFTASRRVARAIFMGSAPSVSTQQVRGVEEVRVNLATVQPGERAAVFNDAIRRMSKQLTYLYSDGTRYWYDTRQTVNRTAEERAQRVDEYQVRREIHNRLKAQHDAAPREALGPVHLMPESSAEIPDEQRARVVVLGPEFTHKNKDGASAAMQEVGRIMQSRGKAPRHHRNMLVFIAPDENRNAEWAGSIRKYLAWLWIERDAASLNLDHQQSVVVQNGITRENQAVAEQLQETYAWLIVPRQELNEPITLEQQRLSGKSPFLERAASKLASNEWLLPSASPDYLLGELKPLNIWASADHLSVKTLWGWLTNYCYLPRLYDREVLAQAIQEGVNRVGPAFGYAAGVNADGSYAGLKWGEAVAPHFDDSEVIVRPDIALAQREKELAARAPAISPAAKNALTALAIDPVDEAPADIAPPAPKPKTRYYGSVNIEAQSAMRDLIQVAEEIVMQLASLPEAEINITLEIEGIQRAGFEDDTIRALSENSRTLKFSDHGFED